MDGSVFLADAAATRALGKALGGLVRETAVVALAGNLGAGKTTFVQGLGEGLGVAEVINSPTFTMLNEYHSGRLPLFHFDLYRLSETAGPAPAVDTLMMELDEITAGPGVVVFEWPEFLERGLPADRLTISLEYVDGEGRSASLRACGDRSAALLRDLAEAVKR